MKNRLRKDVSEHYTSFTEMGEAYGIKPKRKQTRDKEKLMKQRETFFKKHLCPVCKQPMVYIGGNQMVCKNEACKGIKHEITDAKTGDKKIVYSPAYCLLDEKGAEIAFNLFMDYDD